MSSFALQCEKEKCIASTVFIVALVASIFSYCGAIPPSYQRDTAIFKTILENWQFKNQ